jgi:hypothetical protein
MPILTKAAAPIKGTATLFTLDKTALAAVTSVAADAYFSDSANWKSVNLFYHSLVGNQHEIVKFEASQSSPTSKFLVSDNARDVFEIQKIIIKDFDGGTFEVLRSELTTAEFDVDVTPPSGALYTKDFSAIDYASDIFLNVGTAIVLDGATANFSGISGGGNLELTLTNAAMLSALIEGDSYLVNVYVDSYSYLGGSPITLNMFLKSAEFTDFIFNQSSPLILTHTMVAGAGSFVKLVVTNVNPASFLKISKIEIFTV